MSVQRNTLALCVKFFKNPNAKTYRSWEGTGIRIMMMECLGTAKSLLAKPNSSLHQMGQCIEGFHTIIMFMLAYETLSPADARVMKAVAEVLLRLADTHTLQVDLSKLNSGPK